jgi:hypothetical protein
MIAILSGLRLAIPDGFGLSRIGQASDEQDAAGAGVANQKDKGMVSPENGKKAKRARF